MVDINGMNESGGDMGKNKKNGGKNITSIGNTGNLNTGGVLPSFADLSKIPPFVDLNKPIPPFADINKTTYASGGFISAQSMHSGSIVGAMHNIRTSVQNLAKSVNTIPTSWNHNRIAMPSDRIEFELFDEQDNKNIDVKPVSSHVTNRMREMLGDDVVIHMAKKAILIRITDLYKRDILSLNGHTPILTRASADIDDDEFSNITVIHDSNYQYPLMRGAERVGLRTKLMGDAIHTETKKYVFDDMCGAVILNHLGDVRQETGDVRVEHELVKFYVDQNVVLPELDERTYFSEDGNDGVTHQGVVLAGHVAPNAWKIFYNGALVLTLLNEVAEVHLRYDNELLSELSRNKSNFPGLDTFDPYNYHLEYNQNQAGSFYSISKASADLSDNTMAVDLFAEILKDIVGLDRNLLIQDMYLYGVYRLCTIVD